jgi:hypothetical protein
VRVHDAELNPHKQIFRPPIHVLLSCFAIDKDSRLRLHNESGPSFWSASLVVFDSAARGYGRGATRTGGTLRKSTPVAKLVQATSANPQKNKEMFSV